MSKDTDWLDAEGAKLPARKKPKAVRSRRPKALIVAERKLSPERRYYARMLVESLSYADADKRMRLAGFTYNQSTYCRWRQKPDFAECITQLQEWQFRVHGIDKSRLIMDAEKIKQEALGDRPILYKGEATGYKDKDLGTAIRALDFQGKALGITDVQTAGVKVNIDIDFSGRAEGVDGVVIEGDSETLAVE